MNLTISCKALEEITTPQTLKIKRHIKKKKVQAVKHHIEPSTSSPNFKG